MARDVLSDDSPGTEVPLGTLFQGLKFFVSQKVPQRSRFINDIRSNGGEILPIEKHADIKIVDHARKETLPGTYSYRYIEYSVRNGTLEDLEDHRVGPPEGTVRTIGSTIQPQKGTRNRYTQDDDRILWDWVHENPQKGGGTDGNEIYKQLEAKHPQHPWQSWRDRWIKQLKGKPRPFPLLHNAPPTPPSDVPVATSALQAADQPKQSQKAAPRPKSPLKRLAMAHPQTNPTQPKPSESQAMVDDHYTFGSFDENEAEGLMVHGKSILELPPEKVAAAWEAWAHDCRTEQHIHTARDWQIFWEEHVRARYLKRMEKQVTKKQEPQKAAKSHVSLPSRKVKNATQILSSPITERGSDASMGQRSPSNHPDSPSMQLRSPSIFKESTIGRSTTEYHSGTQNFQENNPLLAHTVSNIDQTSKRKKAYVDEEVPSSSPPEMPSPKRRKSNGSELVREIASTPNMTPVRSGKRPESPLIIRSDEEEEDRSSLENEVLYESPLGKQASDTLSEPGRTNNSTQAVFKGATQQIDYDVPPPDDDWDDRDLFLREPTQQVDFEVPPPEDGWENEDSGAEASSESEPIVTETFQPQPIAQETQALLRGKTPAVDFHVPDPEGGWDHLFPLSPPSMQTSPRTESETSDVDAQTEAWINSHVVNGISVDHVIAVLKATTMDTCLAEEILKVLAKDGKIPKDRRGVWTETDDEDLGATDARKIQRLELKHGKHCLTARWDFLDCYKDA